MSSAKYPGNFITNSVDGLCQDVKIKRAMFIERNCEILQEFPFAHPAVKCKINKVYNSSFPGSVLWDLTSRNVEMLINSWSVATRFMWDLPWNSHRYLMEELGGTHAKCMLYTRYVTFMQSISKHKKFPVQFLFQLTRSNLMSVTGRNIRKILDDTGQDDILRINVNELKRKIKFSSMENENQWKVAIIKELVDVKQGGMMLENEQKEKLLSRAEIEEIINYVATC